MKISVQHCVAAFVCTAGGIAALASAQTTTEVGGGQLRFEVLNPVTNTWGSFYADAMSGQQIEWRVVASYTGTRTDLFALGEVLYQPTISNADNTGTGADADQIAPFRNGGNSGNSLPGTMLTQTEGFAPGPVTGGYGRVGYGGTATAATGSNTMTSFRHTSPVNPGPDGSNYIRIAGNFVTQWPIALPFAPSAGETNRILRGISAQQQSQALAPTYHLPGTQNLVLFRQALILSNDPEVRQVNISTFIEAFRRVANTGTDDTRFMSWQTGPSDSGSHRTFAPTIVPATILVNVPAPGMVGAGLGVLILATRRRRP